MRRLAGALILGAFMVLPAAGPVGAEVPAATSVVARSPLAGRSAVTPAAILTPSQVLGSNGALGSAGVRVSTDGQGTLTVSAPASATAWRARAGHDNRYIEVLVQRVGRQWRGWIQWEHRVVGGLHVDRRLLISSFLGQTADALGGCDTVISLCAVSFRTHLPTATQPYFRFFFTQTNGGGGPRIAATGAAWIVQNGHRRWVSGGDIWLN